MEIKERFKVLADVDSELAKLLQSEEKRQSRVIRLIPSENYIYEPARLALGSCFGEKYSEGYPHKWVKGERQDANGRYYQGQEFTNAVEILARDRAVEFFAPKGMADKYHANVQPLAGANANLAVYAALLKPGDRILGMSLAHGGHLTHGHNVSVSSKFFEAHQYGLGEDLRLDYDAIRAQAKEVQPKLIICGASSYPRIIDFEAFASIAKEVGALLHADIAHISGLCGAGAHPSPFPHADVITTTTHKVLRGPRGGLIVCRRELGAEIDKSVFPGLQGGPHMNKIASLATTLKYALSDEYTAYAKSVDENASVLAEALMKRGFGLVTGGTDNHLLLIDLKEGVAKDLDVDGTSFAERLEAAGIVLNKNAVPGDSKPWKPTGVRLGTPAITALGMGPEEMELLASWFERVLTDEQSVASVKSEVEELMSRFALPAWLA